jgi:hypothetical protein
MEQRSTNMNEHPHFAVVEAPMRRNDADGST